MSGKTRNGRPLRVLQVNSGSRNYGGVSSFLFNVYSHMNRDEIQFDFLSPEETTYGIHRDEISRMGGRIWELHIKGGIVGRKIRLFFRLRKFLQKHPYQVIHINSGNFFFNLTASLSARAACVPVRIIHSHNAGDAGMSAVKRAAFRLMKPIPEANGTHFAACGVKAAEYMFTEKLVKSGRVKIFRNGIDTERFAFRPAVRWEVRKELGLDSALVIGHVGRFMKQKNHGFLLEVFSAVLKEEPDAVLLLAGGGELLSEVQKKADEMGISGSVRFLGQRDDMNRIYQAMDVFVLPSLHEGLPVSGVEAQAAGLPVVFSDTITREAEVCGHVVFESLSSAPSVWAKDILTLSSYERKDGAALVSRAGYSVASVAEELEAYYKNAVRSS